MGYINDHGAWIHVGFPYMSLLPYSISRSAEYIINFLGQSYIRKTLRVF